MLSFDKCKKIVPIITLVVLLLCFTLFTYFPLKINLFRDPVYDAYGIISKNVKDGVKNKVVIKYKL